MLDTVSSLLIAPALKGTLGAELPWLWDPDLGELSKEKDIRFLLLNWLLLAGVLGSYSVKIVYCVTRQWGCTHLTEGLI